MQPTQSRAWRRRGRRWRRRACCLWAPTTRWQSEWHGEGKVHAAVAKAQICGNGRFVLWLPPGHTTSLSSLCLPCPPAGCRPPTPCCCTARPAAASRCWRRRWRTRRAPRSSTSPQLPSMESILARPRRCWSIWWVDGVVGEAWGESRQAGGQAGRRAGRQAGRQAGGQAGRRAGRQGGGQVHAGCRDA